MDKEQEQQLTQSIKEEMTKLRNNSILVGMRATLSVVLDMCNGKKGYKKRVKEIMEFCEKGLRGNDEV